MNTATRKALEGSIRKWRQIVAGTGVDKNWENCPLCKMFIKNSCAGCPVRAAVRQPNCHGTPYEDFPSVAQWSLRGGRATTKRARAAAQAELDFLISLRPKTAKRARKP